MEKLMRLRLLRSVIEQIQDKRGKSDNVRLYRRPSNDMNSLYVHFYKDGGSNRAGGRKKGKEIGHLALDHALSCLANDIYVFEEFDLSDARFAEVQAH
jgi:ribosomal protein S18 acetylase RimI-like enzyme